MPSESTQVQQMEQSKDISATLEQNLNEEKAPSLLIQNVDYKLYKIQYNTYTNSNS